MYQTTIILEERHKRFINERCMKLSQYVRRKLDAEMDREERKHMIVP
jgi:hypothetical protein